MDDLIQERDELAERCRIHSEQRDIMYTFIKSQDSMKGKVGRMAILKRVDSLDVNIFEVMGFPKSGGGTNKIKECDVKNLKNEIEKLKLVVNNLNDDSVNFSSRLERAEETLEILVPSDFMKL